MSFPLNSRYHDVETVRRTLSDGSEQVWLARRLPPDPDSLVTVQEHRVSDGDRLDNIAAARLGDPELYWQICDANRAIRPDALTEEIGRTLRITLPPGMMGGRLV
jgi:nucleoid-associated protein YgaU